MCFSDRRPHVEESLAAKLDSVSKAREELRVALALEKCRREELEKWRQEAEEKWRQETEKRRQELERWRQEAEESSRSLSQATRVRMSQLLFLYSTKFSPGIFEQNSL